MSGHLPAVVVYSERDWDKWQCKDTWSYLPNLNHMGLTAFNFVNDELNELKNMNEKP